MVVQQDKKGPPWEGKQLLIMWDNYAFAVVPKGTLDECFRSIANEL